MPRRTFRVDEANALLPAMERALDALEEQRETARVLQDRIQVLELLWGGRLEERSCPDHAERRAHRAGVAAAFREVRRIVDVEITGRGIRFPPGGLEHGLLDFPTTWEGRHVYLCWRRGEPEVRAWHEVDGGFAGRRPLTPEQRARMGTGPAIPDHEEPDF